MSRYLIQSVLTVSVLAMVVATSVVGAPPAAAASAASAASLPRLYSGVAKHGGEYVKVFKVRPRTVSLICAYAGELVVTWRRWATKSARGVGKTRPCRGEGLRVRVKAFRPVDGYFTRLNVHFLGTGQTAHLGLADQVGITWIDLEWMNDPDSGATAWPS